MCICLTIWFNLLGAYFYFVTVKIGIHNRYSYSSAVKKAYRIAIASHIINLQRFNYKSPYKSGGVRIQKKLRHLLRSLVGWRTKMHTYDFAPAKIRWWTWNRWFFCCILPLTRSLHFIDAVSERMHSREDLLLWKINSLHAPRRS